MRKHVITIIILFILILSFSTTVLANSGPVYVQGYPSSEIMIVDENCPIEVEKEELVFDFSEGEKHYSPVGRVTAAYEMKNPTDEMQTVKMAFPLISFMDNFKNNTVDITDNGEKIPYTVYIGESVKNQDDLSIEEQNKVYDFKTITNTINDNVYESDNFNENDIGKHYIIDVNPTTDERVKFTVDFKIQNKKTIILTYGFNGCKRDGENVRVTSWCHDAKTLGIFVLGEDIEYNVNGYTDGELSKKTDDFTYEIREKSEKFRPFLLEHMKKINNEEIENNISDTQLYNMYVKELEEDVVPFRGAVSLEEIQSDAYERIITLIYDVEFQPNSKKNISVSYVTSGTMDVTETEEPIHTYSYIVNPAEYWNSFNNFNVKIITPKSNPYIVKSSLELTAVENNIYLADFKTLPKDDLSFTLYPEPEITLKDNTIGNVNKSFIYLIIIAIGIIIILVIKKVKLDSKS